MSNKDTSGTRQDDEYILLKEKDTDKIPTPNKSEQIKKEMTETSPIILENTLINEETLRKLWMVSGICLIFMVIEVIGGYLANSIAIMSDAAHLLSDFLGFIISIVSIYISRRGATHQMSFGYHRAEVIGALVSVTLIWGLTIWLLYEAFQRVLYPSKVDGLIMLIVAIIGFVFNVVMGLTLAYQGIDHNLHHHHDHDHENEHNHAHESTLKRSKTSIAVKKRSEEHIKLSPKLKHSVTTQNTNVKVETATTGEKKEDHDLTHNHVHNYEKHDHKKHEHHDHKHEKTHIHSDGHVHAPQEYKEKLLVKKSFAEGEHDDHDHDDHDHDDHNDRDLNERGHSHDHTNVNLRAALIHVIGDAVQNLGVVVAGLIIYFYPEASVADPICTVIFSIIVVITTIRILRDCISVLMEGSPIEFDMVKLENDLYNIKGVIEVHDLHVWSLSVGKLSLSCHLTSSNPQITLRKARKVIKNKYKITHSTIQVELDSEKDNEDCRHDLHHEVNIRHHHA